MSQKLFNFEWQITSKSFLLLSFPIGFSFSPTAEISRLELEFEEKLPRKTASIFKEGIGQESNGAANQEKQIFLLRQISPSASSTRDLGTRLVFGIILENLRKPSEGGRKSSENHQKRRHKHVYIIKRTLHGGLKI